MAQSDLERVEADLAAMKAVCVEPAIPTEEIVPNLVIAACGAALLVAGLVLPTSWLGWIVPISALLGAAVYIPWKRRVLRQDAPRRRLEIKENWLQFVGAVLTVGYVVWFRLAASGTQESMRSMTAGIFFLLGATITAYIAVEPRRRNYLGTGIALAVAGMIFPFAKEPATFCAVVFGMMVVVGLSNAAGLWWAARRERVEYGGN